MLKVVLSCSLLANLVLSMLLVADPARRSPAAARAALAPLSATAGAPPAATSSKVPKPAGVAGAGDAGDYYRRLRSLGLSDDEAKALLLARLERGAAAGLEPPTDEYWRSGAEARLVFALRQLDADARVRAALDAVFGEAAGQDPAFTKLYRPLDPHFAFLSSSEQLAVQRFQLQRRLDNLPLLESAASGQAVPPEPPDAAREGRLPTGGGALAAILDAESLLEYELRDSPQAGRLRAAAPDLSEREFRLAFEILRDVDRGDGDVRDHLDARAALRRILGPRGFARLWSSRDPGFAAVARFGRGQGWSEETTLEVYALVAGHEERLLAAVDAGVLDPAALAARVQELDADVRSRLTGLIGEAAADGLLAARAAPAFVDGRAGSARRDAEAAR